MNKTKVSSILGISITLLTVAVTGRARAEAPAAPVVAPAAAPAAADASGAKITFQTPIYDFGKAKAGEPVKFNYVFTNTGTEMLIVSNVAPSCGCTTSGEWTRQV